MELVGFRRWISSALDDGERRFQVRAPQAVERPGAGDESMRVGVTRMKGAGVWAAGRVDKVRNEIVTDWTIAIRWRRGLK